MEVGTEDLLAEKIFDTLIFFDQGSPSVEILLALKDDGKIYFTGPLNDSDEILRSQAKIFSLDGNISLFESEISSQLRTELRRRTPQGQLDEKFSAVTQVADKLPDVIKKFGSLPRKKKFPHLDEYIAEITLAEKILAEIFPLLAIDTIKFNFNLLKESLIDLRLGNCSATHVKRRYEILARDLETSHKFLR